MAKPKSKSKGKRKTPDAIALLKGDHRKVAGLFKKFESARGPAKAALAREICLELSVHTWIEETIFYPAVAPKVEDDLMAESHVEHDSAKILIAEILAMPDVREKFAAQGVEPVGSTPEQFGVHIREQMAKWGKVVRDAGVKPE